MTVHYTALCRGYRLAGAEPGSLRHALDWRLVEVGAELRDYEHTSLGRGGSGRSSFMAGNGAEPRSAATSCDFQCAEMKM